MSILLFPSLYARWRCEVLILQFIIVWPSVDFHDVYDNSLACVNLKKKIK